MAYSVYKLEPKKIKLLPVPPVCTKCGTYHVYNLTFFVRDTIILEKLRILNSIGYHRIELPKFSLT